MHRRYALASLAQKLRSAAAGAGRPSTGPDHRSDRRAVAAVAVVAVIAAVAAVVTLRHQGATREALRLHRARASGRGRRPFRPAAACRWYSHPWFAERQLVWTGTAGQSAIELHRADPAERRSAGKVRSGIRRSTAPGCSPSPARAMPVSSSGRASSRASRRAGRALSPCTKNGSALSFAFAPATPGGPGIYGTLSRT